MGTTIFVHVLANGTENVNGYDLEASPFLIDPE
jgi:hypothetical protein